MSKKTELQEEAKLLGIATDGLTIDELEKAIAEAKKAQDVPDQDADKPNQNTDKKELDVEEDSAEEVSGPEAKPLKIDYDLSVLKDAKNVRVLIDFVNNRCKEDAVISVLNKVNRL